MTGTTPIVTTPADTPADNEDGDYRWCDPVTGHAIVWGNLADRTTWFADDYDSSPEWVRRQLASLTLGSAVIDLAQLPATRIEPGHHVGVAVSVDGGSMQVFEDAGAVLRTLARALAVWEEMVAAPARAATQAPPDPRIDLLVKGGFFTEAGAVDLLARLDAVREA